MVSASRSTHMLHLGPNVDTVGRPVDKRQSDNAWKFYRTNITAMSCSRILKNAVLSTGVTQLSHPHDRFLIRHMDNFARNCIDWLMCIGVVPVFVKVHADGQRLPIVPQPHRVQITVRDLEGGDLGYRGLLDGMMNMVATDASSNVFVWGGGTISAVLEFRVCFFFSYRICRGGGEGREGAGCDRCIGDNPPGGDGRLHTALSALEVQVSQRPL